MKLVHKSHFFEYAWIQFKANLHFQWLNSCGCCDVLEVNKPQTENIETSLFDFLTLTLLFYVIFV